MHVKFTKGLLVVLLAGIAAVATACGSSDDSSSSGSGMSGMSGMDHSQMDSGDSSAGTTSSSDATGNPVDRAFVAQMIPHHEMAVDMAKMAEDMGERQQITSLAGDIVSLVQPFRLDPHRSRILLEGYQGVSAFVPEEWQAVGWILRSQWCQIRLRGSRKVPQDRKVSFVLDRFFEVIDWLDHHAFDEHGKEIVL